MRRQWISDTHWVDVCETEASWDSVPAWNNYQDWLQYNGLLDEGELS